MVEKTCQSALWNFTLSFLRPARVPMNQLQQTDTQTWPGNSYKCERRNYGIKNTGMGNLILWDQKHRTENMFSWHVRNSCPKLSKWLNPESLKSCPGLRIFSSIWRFILPRSVKYAKLNDLSSTWINPGNFRKRGFLAYTESLQINRNHS